jgi:DNA-binding MarR family transcriptional regulator
MTLRKAKDTFTQADFLESVNSISSHVGILSNLIARPFGTLHGGTEDLSVPEWRVLRVLYGSAPMSIGEVCFRTGMPKMQASRAVKRGVELKRLVYSNDQSDARKKLVTLTDEGHSLCERILPSAIARERQVVSPLSPDERKQLKTLLRTLIDHLRQLDE